MQSPEQLPDQPLSGGPESPLGAWPRPAGSWWHDAAQLTWVPGLVLMVSAFTGWYEGSGTPTISVIGWHSGLLGKLIFFIGLAVVALVVLRETGIELPAMVPESLVVIALGSLATVFTLIRMPVPEEVLPADGRGVGIYITLVASLAVIAAGLLQASEEL